jgi:hypothetical protein
MALFGDKGTQANANELYALARQAGFSVQDAVTATAIALAETGGSGQTNDWHNNPVPGGEMSYGPWQINLGDHGQFASRGTPDELVNPQMNAAAAFKLFTARGGFGDWTTYNNGDWQRYLHAARAATDAVPNDQLDSIVKGLMNRVGITAQSTAPGTPSAPNQPGLPTGQADPGAAPTPSITLSNPLDGVSAAVQSAMAPFASTAAAIAGPFAWLAVPGHWFAIGFFLVGGVLVVAGLMMYFKPDVSAADVAQVAKVAAV